jgi:hypothetical protein
MSRLKSALQREYENDTETAPIFYNPRNTHAIELYFRGEKTAKVRNSSKFILKTNVDFLFLLS